MTESGGLVAPERKFSLSWWLGALVIVLLIPAALVFISRDRLNSSSPTSGDALVSSSQLSDPSVDVVTEVGSGQCEVTSTEIRIIGSGMTSCRTTQWSASPYLDQQLSTEVSGIDEGATVVMRFRESGGRRIEVAVGRTAVVIREKDGESWKVVTSVPRQIPPTVSSPVTSVVQGSTHWLKVDLSGNLLTVEIDGVVNATGTTSIDDSGFLSVAAVSDGSVAVRFSSITVTDVG